MKQFFRVSLPFITIEYTFMPYISGYFERLFRFDFLMSYFLEYIFLRIGLSAK